MSAQRPRAYFETLENGLATATDLLLQNADDLATVKNLIYARYQREDERRAACQMHRRDMQTQVENLTSSAARFGESRTSLSAGEGCLLLG